MHTLLYVAGYLPLVYTGGLVLALALNRRTQGPLVPPGDLLPAGGHQLGGRRAGLEWLLNPRERPGQHGARRRSASRGPAGGLDPTWAMPSVILASAWKDLGFVMVILLAGLQAIPERRPTRPPRVDGAGAGALLARHAAAALALDASSWW